MVTVNEVGFWGRTMTPREIAWGFWHAHIMEGFDGVPLDDRNREFFSKNLTEVIEALEPIANFGIGKINRETAEARLHKLSPYKEPVRADDIAMLLYNHAIQHYDLDHSVDIFENPHFINNIFDILRYLEMVSGNPEKTSEDDMHKGLTLDFLRALENPPAGYHPLDVVDDDGVRPGDICHPLE